MKKVCTKIQFSGYEGMLDFRRMKDAISFVAIIFLLILITFDVSAQDKSALTDTTYYKDYSDKLLLRIYTITRFNSLSIKEANTNKHLKLLPNSRTKLGIGFNYKRIGLGIAFGLPSSSRSNEKYGKTQTFDIQGNIYGNKFGGQAFFQEYKGYYNANPNDFIPWDQENFPQLPDMQILSLGVTGFFFTNSEKYSYRAAFVRDAVQSKSAGSFLIGFFANYDDVNTDNGFIPQEFPDSLKTNIDLRDFTTIAFGVSGGYAYNFVVKKRFFISLALIPGFGYQRIHLVHLDETISNDEHPTIQLLVNASMGYEHPQFYLGLTGSVNFRNMHIENYDFELSTEQFRFILGKRFTVK